MKELPPEQALNRAASLCSQSEQCPADIMEKLQRWGIAPTDTARIMARLTSEGYLNETRYALAFVKDKLRFNGWGRIKIGHVLRQKQIAPTAIADALAQIDEEEYRAILQKTLAAKRRQTSGRSPYEVNQKLLRFAVGRGFEAHVAANLLKMNSDERDDQPA